MCLCVVDGKIKSAKGGTGYKVFRKEERHLVGMYHGSHTTYALGEEYVASGGECVSITSEHLRYPQGFHIFLIKADALVFQRVHEGGGVWRVRYSDAVASGLDHCQHLPTVVARRMTILRKVAWLKR